MILALTLIPSHKPGFPTHIHPLSFPQHLWEVKSLLQRRVWCKQWFFWATLLPAVSPWPFFYSGHELHNPFLQSTWPLNLLKLHVFPALNTAHGAFAHLYSLDWRISIFHYSVETQKGSRLCPMDFAASRGQHLLGLQLLLPRPCWHPERTANGRSKHAAPRISEISGKHCCQCKSWIASPQIPHILFIHYSRL